MTRYKKNRALICLMLLYAFFRLAIPGLAQDAGTGNIQVVRDDKVDLLVSKHVQINQNRQGIEGYRIQIFFDSGNNSKTKAQSIFDGFMAKYPGVGTYLTFKSPNYKVRVGDFRTKLDARRFLNEIISEYPNAWIIEDLINLPKVEPIN